MFLAGVRSRSAGLRSNLKLHHARQISFGFARRWASDRNPLSAIRLNLAAGELHVPDRLDGLWGRDNIPVRRIDGLAEAFLHLSTFVRR
jgi:hypothetical protein